MVRPRGTAFPVLQGARVSPASPAVSSAHGAAGDSTVPGDSFPPGGLILLGNPAKGLSPCPGERVGWRQVVESHMAREEER